MSAVTATWRLPYPVATDRPCDFADTMAALALATDGALAGLHADADRLETIPFAVVRATASQVIDPTQDHLIRFDTVDEDTYGMVDLSKDARAIVAPNSRPGYYCVGGYVVHNNIHGTGASSWLIGPSIDFEGSPGASTPGNTTDPLAVSLDGVAPRLEPPFDLEQFTIGLFWTGSGVDATATVLEAVMWAYWERDV